MNFKIIDIKKSTREWDNYVNKAEHSTFFHTSTWLNLIEDVFEVEANHTIIYNEKDELLLFPLFLQEKSLQSPFYADYGGPLIIDSSISNSNDLYLCLDKFINSIGKEKKATRIYVRPHFAYIKYISYLTKGPYRTASKHITYLLSNLDNLTDVCSSFHKKTRNAIRKSLKYDVSIEKIQRGEKSKIAFYYELYLKTKNKQAADPLPIAFFEKLCTIPQENILMYLAKFDGNYRAGLLSFIHKRTIYVFDNCSDPVYSNYNFNYGLYYHLIQYAKNENLNIDFGRTSLDDEDLRRFKSRWGGKQEEYCTYMKIIPPVSINVFKIGMEYGRQHGLLSSIKKFLRKKSM